LAHKVLGFDDPGNLFVEPGEKQMPAGGAVAVEAPRQDPAGTSVIGGDERRAGTVAEQDAHRPIAVIGNLGERFARDDQHVARATGRDERVGEIERVGETRAGRRDIDRTDVAQAQPILNDRGNAGKLVIGRDRRGDHVIDRIELHARAQRGNSSQTQVAGEFIGARSAPFADSGSAPDPLVVGIDDR
jgi:hypothetical protein